MKSSTGSKVLAILLFAVACRETIAAQTAADKPANDGAPAAAVYASPAQTGASTRAAHSDDSFIIGNDDVLAINVWKEPDLTRQIPVRSDGKISLPLVGEIQAAGRTPLQLEQAIADRLRGYINDPQVTVIVQQINSLKFNILGQVAKPGSYPLTVGTTIVDAIAIAGGFRDFAKKKGIYVIRQDSAGVERRLDFNYSAFIKGKDTKQNILLKSHDTVVVP